MVLIIYYVLIHKTLQSLYHRCILSKLSACCSAELSNVGLNYLQSVGVNHSDYLSPPPIAFLDEIIAYFKYLWSIGFSLNETQF